MASRILTSVLVLAFAGSVHAQTATSLSSDPAAGLRTVASPPTPVQSDVVPSRNDECFTPPARDARGLIWGSAEYLLWWVEGQKVPALVTTSAPGAAPAEAGVPGLPGTSVLFGDRTFHDGARSGVRLTIGTWLDGCRTCGVGGEFFILCNQTEDFALGSSSFPILARPIFNTVTQRPDAEIVAFPGLVSGSVSASSESQLLGAAGFFRHELCCSTDCCGPSYRVQTLVGYRYLNLDERITIDENLAAGGTPGSPIPPTTFLVHDSFRTQNQFHGGDIGLAGYFSRGPVTLSALAKIALGANVRDLVVAGSTGILSAGATPTNFDGGLLTAGRTGSVDSCIFAVVPEVRLGVAYRLTDCVQVSVGYNLWWWTNVARAGDQINLAVNPNQLPPVVGPVASQIPAIRDTTMWVQGLSLGLLFNY